MVIPFPSLTAVDKEIWLIDLSVFDQWFLVNPTKNETGKSYLGKLRGVVPV